MPDCLEQSQRYSLQEDEYLFVLNCPPGSNCANAPVLVLSCCGQMVVVNLTGLSPELATQARNAALTQCADYLRFCGDGITPPPPQPPGGPGTPPTVVLFYSSLATCHVICPDGGDFAIQVAAGTAAAATQALADQTAMTYACTLAGNERVCLPAMHRTCCKGVPFSHQLTPSGKWPFEFSIVGGSLPPGLSLSNVKKKAARIAGTPTTEGDYTFTLRAVNGLGMHMDRTYTLPVMGLVGAQPLALPDAVIGQPYYQQLASAGGAPPHTYSLADAVGFPLPKGLVLLANGVIYSPSLVVPDVEVTKTVKILLTDAEGHTCTQTVTIHVAGCAFELNNVAKLVFSYNCQMGFWMYRDGSLFGPPWPGHLATPPNVWFDIKATEDGSGFGGIPLGVPILISAFYMFPDGSTLPAGSWTWTW